MAATQRILTVVFGRELFDKLRPLLDRESLDLSTATSGKGSLVLLRNLDFNLIVVEHPLPDMELAELLGEIRSPEARSAATPVLVLTREDPDNLAAGLEDSNLTCSDLHAASDELSALTARQLGVATRCASRMLVRLEVELGATRMRRACQSVNLSESGLLLRTDRPLPLETEVDLRFSLPDSARSIRARGRIVRHTDPDAEGLIGLAACFDSMSMEDHAAVVAFVADRSAVGSISGGQAQP